MTKFIDYIIKLRWFIALLIPTAVILISLNLKNIEFEGSFRIWFAEDSKALIEYDKFRAIFGNDDAIIIVFKDDNGIMNKKALHVIDRLTQKLWETKSVARVDSLTNYQYVHTDPEYPDDVITEDFIADIDAMSDDDLRARAKIAVKEDMLINRFISPDAKTTMIIARMVPKIGDTPELSLQVKYAVDKYIEAEKDSGYYFHLGGGPVLNDAFVKLGTHDMITFTPLVLIISMLLLWIIFKRPSGMILSITIVIFTFLVVLSIQVLLGYKLNNFTANMPVFIVAIGIADVMHLFWIYLVGRRKGLGNHEAIHYTIEKNFLTSTFNFIKQLL